MLFLSLSQKVFSYLLIAILLIGNGAYAQRWKTDSIDSLVEKGTLRSVVRSFYIKPLLEQYQSIVSLDGVGFEKPKGDLVRKRGFGIRVGYQQGAYELETGLSMIRPMAGFRYTLTGSGYTTQTASTDFYHVPIVFRYRIWAPTKKMSLHLGLGVAYNFDLDKVKLAPDINMEETSIDANGNQVVLARLNGRYDQKKSFFSGEINLSVRYRLASRLNASLEVRRLISADNIVQFNATQQLFNPPTVRKVYSGGGANSYAINIGLSYQINSKKQYQLK